MRGEFILFVGVVLYIVCYDFVEKLFDEDWWLLYGEILERVDLMCFFFVKCIFVVEKFLIGFFLMIVMFLLVGLIGFFWVFVF